MDFERAAVLLHTIKETRDYPNLKLIHDEAMKELVEMNNDLIQAQQQPRTQAKALTTNPDQGTYHSGSQGTYHKEKAAPIYPPKSGTNVKDVTEPGAETETERRV